jgi:glycine/D-amino acid oxidase-like deaminating enzyme/nitrite reductase/ring-hydroxylating ferredoxin subunit
VVDDLPGRPASPWTDISRRPDRAALAAERRADVVVVGAGMVGLTTAALLAREGADVLVLEAGRIGQGVTGRTTAKLSSLQGLVYTGLERRQGVEAARAYADANQAGIQIIAELAESMADGCEFRRKPNYTFADDPSQRASVEREVEAARRAGLNVEFTEATGLPFPVHGAARLEHQAEFHPVRYLLGLAEQLDAQGQRVFERTRVSRVESGALSTDEGKRIGAEQIVLATHLPIADRGGQFALVEPVRSHGLGVLLEDSPPEGMYLSAGDPALSLRSHPHEGREMLILGGRSQRMGTGDPAEDFAHLAALAHDRFRVERIEYRWSAHDYVSADELPLIGPLGPFGKGILLATGLRKWGLAMGAAAARILADTALGRDNVWASTFDPRRLPGPRALTELARNGVATAAHLLGDRVKRDGDAERLAPGEGAVIDAGLGKAAVHRDEAGRLHRLSARCTHLGCIVSWNRAERTWDCPCHGSRFAATGEVVDGPAVDPLPPA